MYQNIENLDVYYLRGLEYNNWHSASFCPNIFSCKRSIKDIVKSSRLIIFYSIWINWYFISEENDRVLCAVFKKYFKYDDYINNISKTVLYLYTECLQTWSAMNEPWRRDHGYYTACELNRWIAEVGGLGFIRLNIH